MVTIILGRDQDNCFGVFNHLFLVVHNKGMDTNYWLVSTKLSSTTVLFQDEDGSIGFCPVTKGKWIASLDNNV